MNTTATHFELGSTVEDSLTGFTGVATSHCESLHMPDMILVENDTDSRWIEESRLKIQA